MKNNKALLSLFLFSSLLLVGCGGTIQTHAEASSVSTYLVLSSIGQYQGSSGLNYEDLFLENTIKYDAVPGSPLPNKSDVSTIASSVGVFSSWVRYDGTGAPTQYTTVPNENGAILYANFIESNITLTSIALNGTPSVTTYDLDGGASSFNPDGLVVTATYSDNSTEIVTSSVVWGVLVSGATSVIGTYTYKGVSKTVTVTGLTITGTSTSGKIYLNAGGSSLWDQGSAWFAAYCWNNDGNNWYRLSSDGSYYSSIIDSTAYTNIIFVRFSNTATTMSWDNSSTYVWNQTNDLTFSGNCYTITGWGTGKSEGSWSNI